jgi:flagellar biosynthesis repressor protein FlbT
VAKKGSWKIGIASFMPLQVKLKAHERVVINGAMIENASDRGVLLLLTNRASVLLEKDMMRPEQMDSPLRQLYFQVQAIHLDPAKRDVLLPRVLALGEAQLPGLTAVDAALGEILRETLAFTKEGKYPEALFSLQRVIGKPGAAANDTRAPRPRDERLEAAV